MRSKHTRETDRRSVYYCRFPALKQHAFVRNIRSWERISRQDITCGPSINSRRFHIGSVDRQLTLSQKDRLPKPGSTGVLYTHVVWLLVCPSWAHRLYPLDGVNPGSYINVSSHRQPSRMLQAVVQGFCSEWASE